MIRYNPKDWFLILFQFHKADTFRKLFPLIMVIAGYSALIAWLETDVWKLSDSSHLKNLSLIHSALGMVISLLLVFRTNTAYERWWEGRKIWGSLVNSSRNLAIKIQTLIPSDATYFRVMIPNYAFALKHHLRGEQGLDSLRTHDAFQIETLDPAKHIPNQIALLIAQRLHTHEQHARIKPEHLLWMNTELQNFTDACGACERIRNTPIPYSYSVFLKKFMFLYVMTLPFGYVFSLGYYTIPVVSLIFYVLSSLELIAEEIEDPFGKDANDLPTDEISDGIQRSVSAILE